MKPHLFLEGDIGCGKSWLLMNALRGELPASGGMCTVRAADAAGRLAGFRVVSPQELCGDLVNCGANADSLFVRVAPGGGIARDDSVFAGYGLRLLRQASSARFVFIDEIGGTEILIKPLRDEFLRIIGGSVPCIGVFKSAPNAQVMEKCMGGAPGYLEAWDALRAELGSHPNVKMVKVSERGDPAALSAIEEWRCTWLR